MLPKYLRDVAIPDIVVKLVETDLHCKACRAELFIGDDYAVCPYCFGSRLVPLSRVGWDIRAYWKELKDVSNKRAAKLAIEAVREMKSARYAGGK